MACLNKLFVFEYYEMERRFPEKDTFYALMILPVFLCSNMFACSCFPSLSTLCTHPPSCFPFSGVQSLEVFCCGESSLEVCLGALLSSYVIGDISTYMPFVLKHRLHVLKDRHVGYA